MPDTSRVMLDEPLAVGLQVSTKVNHIGFTHHDASIYAPRVARLSIAGQAGNMFMPEQLFNRLTAQLQHGVEANQTTGSLRHMHMVCTPSWQELMQSMAGTGTTIASFAAKPPQWHCITTVKVSSHTCLSVGYL